MIPTCAYRVSFSGPDLPEGARASLRGTDPRWEGSERDAEGDWRHRALVHASSEQNAVEAVRAVLPEPDSYRDVGALPVTDSQGQPWTRPLSSWDEIDWGAVPQLARLSGLQRVLLACLYNDAEPTWTVLADRDVSADHDTVEVGLQDLEDHGLIFSALSPSGGPGTQNELVPWRAMTDETWDLLGLIKSPRYAAWLRGELSKR
jgi:hypothetical protein